MIDRAINIALLGLAVLGLMPVLPLANRWKRVGYGIGAFFLVFSAIIWFWPNNETQPHAIGGVESVGDDNCNVGGSGNRVNCEQPILSNQVQVLREIDDFVGNKNENELREIFDFPDMLKFNIMLVKRSARPPVLTDAQSASIDLFFRGGRSISDLRFLQAKQTPGGGIIAGLHGVTLVDTSAKYQNALTRLNQYSLAASVPKDVRIALKEFQQVAESDAALLLAVLHERFEEDPNNIVYEDNYMTPKYFGAVSTPYWNRFSSLRPEADKVSAAIQSHLRTN